MILFIIQICMFAAMICCLVNLGIQGPTSKVANISLKLFFIFLGVGIICAAIGTGCLLMGTFSTVE